MAKGGWGWGSLWVTCDDGAICWQHCSTDREAAVGAVCQVAGPQTLGNELLHLICRETHTRGDSLPPHLVHLLANHRPSDASGSERSKQRDPGGLACHRSLKFVHSSFWWGCWGGSSALGALELGPWSSGAAGPSWAAALQRGSSSTLCLHSRYWLPGRAEGPTALLQRGGGGRGRTVQRSREKHRGSDGWWRWRSGWAAATVMNLEFIRAVGTLQM